MSVLIALQILAAGQVYAGTGAALKPPADLSDYVYLHVTLSNGARRALSCRGADTQPVRL